MVITCLLEMGLESTYKSSHFVVKSFPSLGILFSDNFFRHILYFQVCQMLRIVTFYSTQLPGPNYHCREVRFWKTLHDLCQYDLLQTPGVVKFIVQLLDSVNFLLKQCFTIRYKCLFQGSKLARLPRPESVVEVLLINCQFYYF